MEYSKLLKENFLGHTLSLKDFNDLSENARQSFLEHLIYQSNYIEGISDYWVETVNLGEKVTLPATLSSHRKALEYLIKIVPSNKGFNQREIKTLHGLLMEGLLPPDKAGHYRKVNVKIMKNINWEEQGKFHTLHETVRNCPNPGSLSHLMRSYEEELVRLELKGSVSEEELLENHAYFEWIHPFIDGNGRVGRLLLNGLSLKYKNEFFVIDSSKKNDYYNYLKSIEGKFNARHPRIAEKLKIKK